MIIERSAVKYHHVYNKHKLDNDFFSRKHVPFNDIFSNVKKEKRIA